MRGVPEWPSGRSGIPTAIVVQARGYRNIHLIKEHVAEFDYRPAKCGRDYRMVVVRKLVSHEKGQQVLFPEIRYFFYITNKRDIPAREVVRLANTRCDQERLIGVQKSDVKSFRCPLDNLNSNWAYMVITTLAWNLAKWFALLLPEEGSEDDVDEKRAVQKMNLSTFVAALMRVPAQVVRGARQVRLRLLTWNHWQHAFFRVRDAVSALA